MHTDDDFLRKLLADPTDDTTRLVYADWLDEQGDRTAKKKAEFLRLSVRAAEPDNAGPRRRRRQRLQSLAAWLDTRWLVVVSRLKVENCARPPAGESAASGTGGMRLTLPRFEVICDKRWDEMKPTADPGVRFCEACRENVHYCDTIMAAREHAQEGHCIAVDLGIPRKDDDLTPRRMWMGRPSRETLEREEERVKPDPVSAERERRKRQAEGGAGGA
jgi:uncharacterized protein (TIGR02996 family)